MRHLRSSRTIPAAALALAALAAAVAYAAETKPAPSPAPPSPAPPAQKAPAPKPVPPPGPTALVPRAWPRSTYSTDGRVEIAVGNASFEAPAAYQQSFGFWIGRMKGTIRTELVQYILSTREALPGRLPF